MRVLDDPVTFTVLTEIRTIEHLSHQRLQRALPGGLDVSHFAVLNHLSSAGGPKSPAQLARIFQLTKGAMTNTIGRLERQGFVEVTGDQTDRRRKLVALTDKGRMARDVAVEAIAPVFREIGEAVGRDQLRQMLPGLRTLRSFLASEPE